jgi:predicted metalloprotease with PDZ domain
MLSSKSLPQPLAQPPSIEEPRDVEYAGAIELHVDATDVVRRIFSVREIIPVGGPGEITLLYPRWLPGYHAPQAPIELLAGLEIAAGDEALCWRRHPTEINAFHVDVPEGCSEIEAKFQFLSPTDSSQGREIVSPDLLNLQWNTVALYPAGHFARRITVEPELTLPEGWEFGCALQVASRDGGTIRFEPVALDVLVDSPVFAGAHFRCIGLDDEREQVWLNIVADRPELLEASDEQIEPHRELVRQADRLFGARHFDRYDVLLALSDEIGSIGVEHHRSCEAASIRGYFAEWDKTFARRDTIPHEYVHSWNGKYRRGADSWTPSFEKPIRNSLMWVYEGQTQYWDKVLCARSGLWTGDQALASLAETAATHEIRAGSRWRPLSDTTRDPIIAGRAPLPWPSWQRSEDYYTEGALVWLEADTRIRELTGNARSLDDFARRFFGMDDGSWVTNTYTFEDVVGTLEGIAAFDWRGFFDERLNATTAGAPLGGIDRGGYRLVYKDHPSDYQTSKEAVFGVTNLLFSIGLMLSHDGGIKEVLWEGPAFRAGLTAGSKLLGVNGRAYEADELKAAIAAAAEGRPIELTVETGKRTREVTIDCPRGHRYPHLEPQTDGPRLLDDILAPLPAG